MRTYFFFLTTLFLCALPDLSRAQDGIARVLDEVGRNNKTLRANAQYWEAQKIQFNTGLLPNNPTIGYDFLGGRPVGAGNQHEFTLMQEFDFPTVYTQKARLAEQQSAQSVFELATVRQGILLDAQKTCLGLVYHHQLRALLERRERGLQKLLGDFQARLDRGEGTILDIHKAKLQLVELGRQMLENEAAIRQLDEKLAGLNGGTSLVFADTVYPERPVLPELAQLENECEQADPRGKSLEQQQRISQQQLEVARAQWLPKFEVGYRYQGILGQTYNGFHTGFSVPLWENKNTVRLQEAKIRFDELNLQDYRNEHHSDLRQLYEKYRILDQTLLRYQALFADLPDAVALLDKALALGQLTAVEYFLETDYYHSAFQDFLATEKELRETEAELLRHRL